MLQRVGLVRDPSRAEEVSSPARYMSLVCHNVPSVLAVFRYSTLYFSPNFFSPTFHDADITQAKLFAYISSMLFFSMKQQLYFAAIAPGQGYGREEVMIQALIAN